MTGAIHKAEALIRWQHPKLGLVSPADFIPIAEDTGQIIEIGEWVFRQSVAQVARLRAMHHPEFQISVNKSPIQFRASPDNHKPYFDYLTEVGLPGQSIVVERSGNPKAVQPSQANRLRLWAGLSVFKSCLCQGV